MGGYKTRFLKLLMKISLYWTQFLHNYYMCHEFKAPLKFLCYFVICAMEFTAPLEFLCSFVICVMEFKAILKFLFALVICDLDICVQIRPKLQFFRLIIVWCARKHTWFLWVYWKHTSFWSCGMIAKIELVGKQRKMHDRWKSCIKEWKPSNLPMIICVYFSLIFQFCDEILILFAGKNSASRGYHL